MQLSIWWASLSTTSPTRTKQPQFAVAYGAEKLSIFQASEPRAQMTWEDILIGEEVTTGAWLVPDFVGDCPVWSIQDDIILI
jgi:hypothetical protein